MQNIYTKFTMFFRIVKNGQLIWSPVEILEDFSVTNSAKLTARLEEIKAELTCNQLHQHALEIKWHSSESNF